jgi:glycosyltransferase involved in cell wall biosynthesis
MDILNIYQFCSFGGVERALLNRAMAFKSHDLKVAISVGYLHDYGALNAFRSYIKLNRLEKYLVPFLITEDYLFDKTRYDITLIIDTPQVFDKFSSNQNVFVECHTPNIENRQYLKELPENIKGIIIPSKSFQSLLLSEFPGLKHTFVLPNPIPEVFFAEQNGASVFTKRPVAYVARVDALKNYDEALQLFASIKDLDDVFFMVIGVGATFAERLAPLEKNGLLDRTFRREHIQFDAVPAMINMIRNHRGVFISPSKGESFGLTAAEFICGGVPVLLSNIPEHMELVNNDDRFLYPLGDVNTARRKLIQLLTNWDQSSSLVRTYRSKFKSDSFITSWNQFLQDKDA